MPIWNTCWLVLLDLGTFKYSMCLCMMSELAWLCITPMTDPFVPWSLSNRLPKMFRALLLYEQTSQSNWNLAPGVEGKDHSYPTQKFMAMNGFFRASLVGTVIRRWNMDICQCMLTVMCHHSNKGWDGIGGWSRGEGQIECSRARTQREAVISKSVSLISGVSNDISSPLASPTPRFSSWLYFYSILLIFSINTYF